jgi:hypothetical protein
MKVRLKIGFNVKSNGFLGEIYHYSMIIVKPLC